MEVFLAIAVAAVAIATLVVAMSFGKRTNKQVSAILDQAKDATATNNETAINELRAQRGANSNLAIPRRVPTSSA